MFKNLSDFTKERLQEKSTYVGLIIIITVALGVDLPEDMIDKGAMAILTLVGIYSTISKEKQEDQ